MTKPNSRLPADLRWALKRAYSFAAVYCVWVLGLYVVAGEEPFRKLGAPFWAVELFYLAAAGLVGIVVGLLRPLIRRTVGAYFVGVLAGVIIISGGELLLAGNPMSWDLGEWIPIGLFGPIAGFIIGGELRKAGYPSVKERHPNSAVR